MPIPYCIDMPDYPGKTEVTLPGSGPLKMMSDKIGQIPRPSSLLAQVMNIIGPSMSGINRYLRMLAVVVALIDCAKSIKKTIEEGLNLKYIVECIEKLHEAVANLLALYPPASYVRAVRDVIVVMRVLVADLISLIGSIDQETSNVKSIMNKALTEGDSTLLKIGECAQEQLNTSMSSIYQPIEAIAATLDALLGIMELLSSFIPGDIAEKVEDLRDTLVQIDNFSNNLNPSSNFPPLADLLYVLNLLYDALQVFEQLLSPIAGKTFQAIAVTLPTLVNPGDQQFGAQP